MEHASVNPGQNTLVNAQLSTKVKIVKVSCICICPPYGGCETLKARCLYPDQLLKKNTNNAVYVLFYSVWLTVRPYRNLWLCLYLCLCLYPNVFDFVYIYIFVYVYAYIS